MPVTISRPSGICEQCFASGAQSGIMTFPNLNEHLLIAFCPHSGGGTGAIGIQVADDKTEWLEQSPITQAEFLGQLERTLGEVKRLLDATKRKMIIEQHMKPKRTITSITLKRTIAKRKKR